MKLTAERLPESRVLLEIAADDDEFAKAMDRAYRKVAGSIAMPGFRKGKAPRRMVERAYGRGVFLEEANRGLMNDLYRRAVEEEQLVPVGDPEVELVAAEPLAFKVTIPVYPTIEPGAYTDVRTEPVDAAVDEAAVDAVIEQLRKQNSPWIDPADEGMAVGPDLVLQPKSRTPREGDQITVDYHVKQGDEDAETPQTDAVFVVGESGLLEPVEDRIKELRVGETATFDVPFAEDDETVESGLRGKTLAYTVTLKGLKERDLLPLDDDFAREVADDLQSLDQLRGRVRDNLHREKSAAARAEVLNTTVDRMLEGATLDVPAPMIDETVEADLRGMRQRLAGRGISLEAYLRVTEQTEEELRAELRPDAERRLRRSLLLREVAQREGIDVDDGDLATAVDQLAATAPAARDPEQMAEFYKSDMVRDAVRSDLFERKLFDRIIEIATEGRGAVTNAWEPAPESEAVKASAEATDAGDGEPGPAATAASDVVTSDNVEAAGSDIAATVEPEVAPAMAEPDAVADAPTTPADEPRDAPSPS